MRSTARARCAPIVLAAVCGLLLAACATSAHAGEPRNYAGQMMRLE